jgi:hypothetical protein
VKPTLDPVNNFSPSINLKAHFFDIVLNYPNTIYTDRGFGRGRGRQPFNNRGNFNRGRGLYHHGGRSQIGRMGFRDDPEFSMHPDFHQWQFGPQGSLLSF